MIPTLRLSEDSQVDDFLEKFLLVVGGEIKLRTVVTSPSDSSRTKGSLVVVRVSLNSVRNKGSSCESPGCSKVFYSSLRYF
jgi:hypothetical protein